MPSLRHAKFLRLNDEVFGLKLILVDDDGPNLIVQTVSGSSQVAQNTIKNRCAAMQ